MQKMNMEEMLETKAGGLSASTVAAICAIGSFIIGIFDGLNRLK